MDDHTLLTIATAIVLVVALLGTLLPVIPGIGLMWAAALVYGLIVGFDTFGVATMIFLSILTIASVALGFLVPKRAAEEFGVQRSSQLVGLVFGVVGFFLIPVFGVIIGALAGILLAEYLDKDDMQLAWQATVATAKGFGISALIQFGLGFAMLVLWSAWAVTVVW